MPHPAPFAYVHALACSVASFLPQSTAVLVQSVCSTLKAACCQTLVRILRDDVEAAKAGDEHRKYARAMRSLGVLATLGDEQVLNFLYSEILSLKTDSYWCEVNCSCLDALDLLAHPGDLRAINAASSQLHHYQWHGEVADTAMHVLSHLSGGGKHQGAVLQVLRHILEIGERHARYNAMKCLSKVARWSDAEVRDLFDDARCHACPGAREGAFEVLGEMAGKGDAVAITWLVSGMGDGQEEVVAACIYSLGQVCELDDSRAIAAVLPCLRLGGPGNRARRAACSTLPRLTKQKGGEILALVLELVEHPDEQIRNDIVNLFHDFGIFGDVRCIDAVIALCRNWNGHLLDTAWRIMLKIVPCGHRQATLVLLGLLAENNGGYLDNWNDVTKCLAHLVSPGDELFENVVSVIVDTILSENCHRIDAAAFLQKFHPTPDASLVGRILDKFEHILPSSYSVHSIIQLSISLSDDHERVFDFMLGLFAHESECVQEGVLDGINAAIDKITVTPPTSILTQIERLSGSKSCRVREKACICLIGLRGAGDSAFLRQCLSEKSPAVRIRALRTYACSDNFESSMVEALVWDKEPQIRIIALEKIASDPERQSVWTAGIILKAMEDEIPKVRQVAFKLYESFFFDKYPLPHPYLYSRMVGSDIQMQITAVKLLTKGLNLHESSSSQLFIDLLDKNLHDGTLVEVIRILEPLASQGCHKAILAIMKRFNKDVAISHQIPKPRFVLQKQKEKMRKSRLSPFSITCARCLLRCITEGTSSAVDFIFHTFESLHIGGRKAMLEAMLQYDGKDSLPNLMCLAEFASVPRDRMLDEFLKVTIPNVDVPQHSFCRNRKIICGKVG